ncbi:putative defensin-like protein 30 [Punica granatum]|uniref:Defensin-like protein 30 n=1 Tax=Punica granatum TaxID=22663 RepID=A0A6P8E186_PUNGR|nr:putative defensin-like protein 30 [Punica granatum]
MVSGKVSFSQGFLIGLLCLAALFSAGHAEGGPTFVVQGPCSQFPDCDKHCRDNGYGTTGGSCMSLSGGPSMCYCIITSCC